MTYAKVHILDAPYHIDKAYTYLLPQDMQDTIDVGSIVVVPFGGANKERRGIVTELSEESELENIKPLLGVPGKYLHLDSEQIKLCKFMKEQLFCTIGEAVECMIPSGLGIARAHFFHYNYDFDVTAVQLSSDIQPLVTYIQKNKKVSDTAIKNQFGAAAVKGAYALERLGVCTASDGYEVTVNEKVLKYVSLSQSDDIIDKLSGGFFSLSPKQTAAFETLLKYESPCPIDELCQSAGVSVSVINQLQKKGVADIINVDENRNRRVILDYADKGYSKDFDLTSSQKEAFLTLKEIYKRPTAAAALLHGITGSGKTNVIMKLIEETVSDGKSVIVLVPEIALTGQTVGRFRSHFGDSIAVVHSALSSGERMDAWRAILDGRARIVIGTRSAVFAPVKNLGLIVIDEEQESSFKSERSPKYHARDIARFRCAYNNAMMLLASATPSIDSYYKASIGKYTLVSLTERYGNAVLPEVLFHDMRNEPYFDMKDEFDENEDEKISGGIPTTIGTTLEGELAENLVKGEQSILFINRRGFRAFAQCHSCGHTFQCPNCSVSLTHHRNKRYNRDTMSCHYCGYTMSMPTECPVCKKSESIVYMGAGTQLIESQLQKLFPRIRILRMDADTTGGKFSHEEILDKFRRGEADVLVGTQMVAKGHDFPDVSLVGVINADGMLHMGDFRANERTFSLLTQVMGRSGRGDKKGRAVIQTYTPDNEVLSLSSKQDYTKFYEQEIVYRRASLFPPFCDIITITFASEIEESLAKDVKLFYDELTELAGAKYKENKFILFGPFRHEIYKIGGKYRMRFIIKCINTAKMREMLSELYVKYSKGLKLASISVDVNPQNL